MKCPMKMFKLYPVMNISIHFSTFIVELNFLIFLQSKESVKATLESADLIPSCPLKVPYLQATLYKTAIS